MKAEVEEQETARWTIELVSHTGDAIPDVSVESAVLSLYDSRTGGIINSLDGADCLNTGRGTLASSLLTILFEPADNAIVYTGLTPRTMERHTAQVVVTYDSGKILRKEIDIFVKQMTLPAV